MIQKKLFMRIKIKYNPEESEYDLYEHVGCKS